MSFRKIVLSMLVLWLGAMGIACGVMCLICLLVYLLWQGLGVSSVVLALLCLFCLVVAVMLSGRAAAHREPVRVANVGVRSVKSWLSSLAGTTRTAADKASVLPGLDERSEWPEKLDPQREWSMRNGGEQRR